MSLRGTALASAFVLAVSSLGGGAGLAQTAGPDDARSIAKDLRRAALDAAEAARSDRTASSRGGRELVASLDEFVRRVRALESRFARASAGSDPSREIDALDRSAKRVATALGKVRAGAAVTRAWADVGDARDRLERLPAQLEEAEDEEARDARDTLDEIRRVADDLERRAASARDLAQRFTDDNPGYARDLLGAVVRLANGASALRRAANASRVDRRSLGARAQALLTDAQGADEEMRRTSVFRDAWSDFGDAIDDLSRIVELAPGN